MSRGDSRNLMVVSLVAGTTMHIAGSKFPMSRFFMAAAGLFLAVWGSAIVLDYMLPGYFWQIFLVLAVILLGFLGKAVYDGRLR